MPSNSWLALTIGIAPQCRLKILTTISRTVSVGLPVTTPVDITSWIRMRASISVRLTVLGGHLFSQRRGLYALRQGGYGAMVEVITGSATLATHQPQASIRVVIALEHRLQFMTTARGTRQFVQVKTQSCDRIVLNYHATPPSRCISHFSSAPFNSTRPWTQAATGRSIRGLVNRIDSMEAVERRLF